MALSIENWDEGVAKYLSSIKSNVERNNYTEHTHRPALKEFIETICPRVVATNEPKRTESGAPDLIVTKGISPIGYIETKDVGLSLDEAEKSDQLKRYLAALSNLILTNYLEFRWYVNGVLRPPIVCIANLRLEASEQGIADLKNLLTNFLNADVRTVKDSKILANMLANLARTLQTSISSAYEMEGEDEELHVQLQSFREILLPDLEPDQFADMISQTITYGLFISRCYCEKPEDFTREKSAYFIPRTNPFLRKLFSHLVGPDLNVRYSWIVDDIIDLLAKSDLEEILKDFGKVSRKEDPVIHFYETFLSAFNPEIKEKRGVFYTPTPVVNYIVKSIDEILKRDFSIKDGLFDPSVLVLDPALGTGTFLYSLIQLIRQNMAGQEGSWNDYISQKLLDRMFGFELLMAPYVIAHLKLNLELQAFGYKFATDKRLGIYLTNSLEEGLKRSEVLFAKWLSDEANAAADIKREKPILVVFGNPPYSGHSANMGDWIRKLVYDYRLIDGKEIQEKQIKWLQDDYVKFIRFGQWRIDRTGRGIIGFITNHAYLDNPTFRAMRKNLMDHFNEIYILNLHGNKNRRTTAPDGRIDENVFDIRQGVAISIFVKNRDSTSQANVYYAELWGDRESKYSYLDSNTILTTKWSQLNSSNSYYYFVPTDRTLDSEYNQGYSLTEIFPINNVGFVTARDAFAIDSDKNRLISRIDEFRDPSISDERIKEKYKLHDTTSWSLSEAREKIRRDRDWRAKIVKCLYRPFDIQYIYFSEDLLERPVIETSGPLLTEEDYAFVGMRQVVLEDVPYTHFTVSQHPIDNRCFRSNKGIVQVFPLYIYNAKKELIPNIGKVFRDQLCRVLNKQWSDNPSPDKIDPFLILCYVTAFTFSENYRTQYSENLRREFPKIPIIADYDCFTELAELGKGIIQNLILDQHAISTLITRFPLKGSNEVENRYPVYDESTMRVCISKEQYFEGITKDVWNYQIGGRQISFEWLKERRGKELTYDDKTSYQRMIVSITNLIEISSKIDKTLEKCLNHIKEKIKPANNTLLHYTN